MGGVTIAIDQAPFCRNSGWAPPLKPEGETFDESIKRISRALSDDADSLLDADAVLNQAREA